MPGRGLQFPRFYTLSGADPWASVSWEQRDVEETAIEIPAGWSETAARIVASRYLRRPTGAPRETSVRQMVGRVVDAVVRWGRDGGYFAGEGDAEAFEAELIHILLHQIASFNSPVWFNVGIEPQPQCAGTFILSVDDSMESILALAQTEGLLFKHGAGTGTNLSSLRAAGEPIAACGRAAGPVSFMRGLDALAGTLQCGGKTRRAAKMALLDDDHPDLLEFIRCKALEERKAWSLIDAGYEGAFDQASGAYGTVGFQNANHSVRASDAFLEAAVAGGRARELLCEMAEAAWLCGDPGVQYDTTINAWNTCSASGRIRASNSCSEFLFLDDTACPLASLNLMRLRRADGSFDPAAGRHVCEVMASALDMMIEAAGYPRKDVGERSRQFRPLGLGYANLGALLMASGHPYDSASGRHLAAAITALLSGAAWVQSARLARALGPFSECERNRAPLRAVLHRHRSALRRIDPVRSPPRLLAEAARAWDEAVSLADRDGVRNAQVSALAPTGTISFLMDCDTTGIEPDLSLVKSKRLAGGGVLRMVNRTVPESLRRLGYEPAAARRIVDHLEEKGTIDAAPGLDRRHLAVFDCAFPARRGGRAIAPLGHLRMMAAVQPFLCGGISKTINLRENATPEDIVRIFLAGWRLGLKAVAVYRDGCKRSQPMAGVSSSSNRASESRKPVAAFRL